MADPNASTQASEPREDDIDASIDADIKPEPTQPDSMNLDGANDPLSSSVDPPQSTEPRIPAKKDASLREFLGKMDDYAPIVSTANSCYFARYSQS